MKPGHNALMLVGVALGVVCLAIGAPLAEPPPPEDEASPPPTESPPGGDEEAAQAQPQEAEPEAVRIPRQPRPEDIIREFQKQRPQLVPVLPTGPEDETVRRSLPDETAAASRRPARLPDGAMLADRAGRIIREGQWWVFVFESDSSSYPEPPMKLLPNKALERMVRESRGGLDPVVFVITAEVTDFRAENYLLPRKVLRKRNLGNLKK